MRVLPILFFLVLLAFTYRHTSSGHSQEPGSIDTTAWPASFGFGRPATQAAIAALDISIRPDGKGLPAGSGNTSTGKAYR